MNPVHWTPACLQSFVVTKEQIMKIYFITPMCGGCQGEICWLVFTYYQIEWSEAAPWWTEIWLFFNIFLRQFPDNTCLPGGLFLSTELCQPKTSTWKSEHNEQLRYDSSLLCQTTAAEASSQEWKFGILSTTGRRTQRWENSWSSPY